MGTFLAVQEGVRKFMAGGIRSIIYTSRSAEDTILLGERLGRLLNAGSIVALYGNLGAGKTILVKGIARGLGINATIHSPTFTLIHEHPGPIPLYHIDLYRVEEKDLDFVGIDEYLEMEGIVVIEWAEKIKSLLPSDRLDVELRTTNENSRVITLSSSSPKIIPVIEVLARDADPSS
ncbi:MAG: tRNA (adenosine(37)-N6)-threonylcarbamoyltransferase complex ATPase subunit type 1 TsaE [Armatimonadota bacterium]